MSSGFSFGAKSTEAPAFGQTPVFGAPQTGSFAFGAPATNANVLPQFTSTFGGGTTTGGFASANAATSGQPFGPGTPAGGFQHPPANATLAQTFGTPTFSFNPPAAQAQLKPTGISFGTPAPSSNANVGIAFGTPLTSQATNLFSTPAAALPNTGLTFGTPKAAPGIGLPFSSAQALAVPAIAPTFGTSVSAMPASTAGLMFGTPTAPASGFGFSVPAAPTKPAPTFASSVATTGVSFGASGPLLSVPNKGLTFGSTTVPNTAPTFGTPTLQPATGLSFAPPASSAPTTGLSFNVAKPSAPSSLGFTAPTNLTFGAPPVATTGGTTFSTSIAANSGSPFSLSGQAAATTVASFATPTTTKTTVATTAAVIPAITSTGPISFASSLVSSAVTSSAGLPLDLGGSSLLKLPTATTSAGFSLLPPPPTTTTTTSIPHSNIGLGGISAAPPKQPPASTNITTEQVEVAPRDQALPNELLQTVENFKKFVHEQKSFSSEISRFSVKDLKKVENDIDLVNSCISEMESELQKNKAVAEKLKYDTAKSLQYVEMAQRTYDTPSGLQYDNTAPLNYFIELCDHFEKDMYALKVHIENIDKCVRNTGPPAALTSQDLALGMRRLHETFVALAGRLQSVHTQVELQKEQYLNIRKQVLNDYTNVFEGRSKELEALEVALDSIPYQPPSVFTGPTPFSSLGNSQAQALAQNPPPSYPVTTPLGVSAPGFSVGAPAAVPLFGSSTPGASMLNTSTAFQLQKPPIGNKRGKP